MVKRDASQPKLLGHLGECYVITELLKKRFRTYKVSEGFYYDLLGENHAKIEVKTALPTKSKKIACGRNYEYKVWTFNFSDQKQNGKSDFYVYVLLDDFEKNPIAYFVYPKEEHPNLSGSGNVGIYESDISGFIKKKNKMDRHKYLNKWDLILDWKG